MKIWKIAGVLSLCTLAGCGNLSAEDEQQLKDGLQEASHHWIWISLLRLKEPICLK